MKILAILLSLASLASAQATDSNGWLTPNAFGAQLLTSWTRMLQRAQDPATVVHPVQFDGATISATCSGSVFTVSGYTPQVNEKGAVITANGGTGILVGRYRIVTVSGQTYTVDRACTGSSGSALTGWVTNGQATIVALGDSNMPNHMNGVRTALRAAPFAIAGEGWLSTSCCGNGAASPFANLSNPVFTGTWTNGNAGTQGGNATTAAIDGYWFASSDTATSGCGGTGACVSITGTFTDIGLHYLIQSGLGTFQWRLDSGSWTQVSTNGTTTAGVVEIPSNTGTPLSLTSHTVDVQVVSGTVRIVGWNPHNGARGVLFHMLAHPGGSSATFNVTNATQVAEYQDLQPDVVTVTLCNNDAESVPLTPDQQATKLSNMLANARSANPDVSFLFVGPPEDITSTATTLTYITRQAQLAQADGNSGWVSIHPLTGHYAVANALGYMDGSHDHLSTTGIAFVTAQVIPFLLGSYSAAGHGAVGGSVTIR